MLNNGANRHHAKPAKSSSRPCMSLESIPRDFLTRKSTIMTIKLGKINSKFIRSSIWKSIMVGLLPMKKSNNLCLGAPAKPNNWTKNWKVKLISRIISPKSWISGHFLIRIWTIIWLSKEKLLIEKIMSSIPVPMLLKITGTNHLWNKSLRRIEKSRI